LSGGGCESDDDGLSAGGCGRDGGSLPAGGGCEGDDAGSSASGGCECDDERSPSADGGCECDDEGVSASGDVSAKTGPRHARTTRSVPAKDTKRIMGGRLAALRELRASVMPRMTGRSAQFPR